MPWCHSTILLLIVILLMFSPVQAQHLTPGRSLMLPGDTPSLQFTPNREYKSVMLAIGASMLLPGLGEYYAGNFGTTGKYALTAEGVIWVSYAAFQLHGTWLKNDAQSFAMDRAGVSFEDKDAQFEVDLGNFLSVQDYNESKLRSRQSSLLYTDPSFSWIWTSDADRRAFRDQRIRGDRVLDASKFLVALAVVNRIISAFSAGKAAAAHNRAERAKFSLHLDHIPEHGLPRVEGTVIRFAYHF